LPQRRRRSSGQAELGLAADDGLSTPEQQYDVPRIINEIRGYVDNWRRLPNPNQWQVTPETARLLQHWRHHQFNDLKPFFCQIEAVETAIWLTEVASDRAAAGAKIWTHIRGANKEANPELLRIALKLATGRRQDDGHGDADRLADGQRVAPPGQQPVLARLLGRYARHHDQRPVAGAPVERSEQLLRERELVPTDMLGDISKAKIVITNYHAFRRREDWRYRKPGGHCCKVAAPS